MPQYECKSCNPVLIEAKAAGEGSINCENSGAKAVQKSVIITFLPIPRH